MNLEATPTLRLKHPEEARFFHLGDRLVADLPSLGGRDSALGECDGQVGGAVNEVLARWGGLC
jgi:hypothetical protein